MASDAPRTSVPSADGRSAGASLADQAGAVAGSSAGPAGAGPDPLAGRRFFVSWSGGKDAYLALQRAVRRGGEPAALVCMLHEDGRVSRGHGLPLALLEEQAAALGVPLVTRATTWDGYEATFVSLLHELRGQGVEAGVFGDIDLQAHRDWVEGVCEVAGLGCHLPLWQEPRRRAAGRVPRRRLPRHHRRRRLVQAGRRVPRPRAGRRRHRPPRGRRRRRLRRGGRVPHHGHPGPALLASGPARLGRRRGARRPPRPQASTSSGVTRTSI